MGRARRQGAETMQTIQDIIENCRLGGISLEQRLQVVEYSTIRRLAEEAELIKIELKRRQESAA